jgi:hypothetical protein
MTLLVEIKTIDSTEFANCKLCTPSNIVILAICTASIDTYNSLYNLLQGVRKRAPELTSVSSEVLLQKPLRYHYRFFLQNNCFRF